jgi:hypothetical protein
LDEIILRSKQLRERRASKNREQSRDSISRKSIGSNNGTLYLKQTGTLQVPEPFVVQQARGSVGTSQEFELDHDVPTSNLILGTIKHNIMANKEKRMNR